MPTAVDLFSGAGGLTLGLRQAGFTVLAAVEVDVVPARAYAANHPNVKLWCMDIRRLGAANVMRALGKKRGEIDLIAGCPPCQGFSSMRTLNGHRPVRDDRNELIFDFLRFVRVLRPKAVMLENVPGLAKDARFGTFCTALSNLGYVINAEVKDAKDYAVPQRRRRLILLAALQRRIPFCEKAEAIVTVRQAIGHLPAPGHTGDAVHDLAQKRGEKVQALIQKIPKNGGSRTALPDVDQLACHRRCDGFRDVYGRMAWDAVAPTITSGCYNPSKGRFLHPEQDRAITMREAALLQTFPQSYMFPDYKMRSVVALMIGNALPPEFIRRHAAKIAEGLRAQKEEAHECVQG